MDRDMWQKIKIHLLFACGDIAYVVSGRIEHGLGMPRAEAFHKIAYRVTTGLVLREVFAGNPQSLLEIGLGIVRLLKLKREEIEVKVEEYVNGVLSPILNDPMMPPWVSNRIFGELFEPHSDIERGISTLLSLHGDSLYEANGLNPKIMASRVEFRKANLFSASALSRLSVENGYNPYTLPAFREIAIHILSSQIATQMYLSPLEIGRYARLIGDHLENIWRSLRIF